MPILFPVSCTSLQGLPPWQNIPSWVVWTTKMYSLTVLKLETWGPGVHLLGSFWENLIRGALPRICGSTLSSTLLLSSTLWLVDTPTRSPPSSSHGVSPVQVCLCAPFYKDISVGSSVTLVTYHKMIVTCKDPFSNKAPFTETEGQGIFSTCHISVKEGFINYSPL